MTALPVSMAMNTLDTAARRARAAERAEFGEGGGGVVLVMLLGVSVAAHAALFGTLGHLNRGARVGAHRHEPSIVTVDIAPPRPPPPVEVAEDAPRPRAVGHRLAVRVPAPPAAPVAETPADFSGVTLTNDAPGPGWSSAVGNGAAMRGPIGTPGAKVTGRSREGGPPPEHRDDDVVALASLSRPPAPPELGDLLERRYPELARRQGLAGQAVVKARITPTGQARDLVILSQSTAGFGDACRATLRESLWSPPLDRGGRAVATLVTYTCRFEVR